MNAIDHRRALARRIADADGPLHLDPSAVRQHPPARTPAPAAGAG
jgi:hypothetical protein